ncbi:MAG: hypothetical protein U0V73_16365 [Acidimicrobiia bacterium]
MRAARTIATTLATLGIGLLAGGTVLVMVAAPADAQTGSAPGARTTAGAPRGALIAQAKQRADEAIDRRLQKLGALQTKVNTSRAVTAAHRSTLLGQLGPAYDGLAALRTTIDAESNPVALRSEMQSIVDAYRVYALVEPRVGEVLAADEELAAVAKLEAVAAKIDSRITALAGKDTTAAAAALASMRAATSSARQHVSGVADSVIGLTASGYPANRTSLQAAHEALRQGREDLRTARREGVVAVNALKASAA